LATSATSEGAQGIISKITFLKSVHSKEKDEACLGFLVKIFTKSVHRRGAHGVGINPLSKILVVNDEIKKKQNNQLSIS
jgi:hypothetical protein